MLAVLQTLLAATEEEASKAPYYIAGLVLAGFAVVISAIGIRGHETFPGSRGAAAAVMGLATVLVVATMATAVLTG